MGYQTSTVLIPNVLGEYEGLAEHGGRRDHTRRLSRLLFILVYQFGFKYSAHVTHMLETSRVYLLLAFFTGISLRYILKFKEIIQEKMFYLDIGIYFFPLCRAIGQSILQRSHPPVAALPRFPHGTAVRLFPPAVAERHPFVAADIHAVTKAISSRPSCSC